MRFKYKPFTYLTPKTQARMARDTEFLEMYDSLLSLLLQHNVKNPVKHAVRFTLRNGTPRYHVGYRRAYDVVRHILKTGEAPLQGEGQSRMWLDFADRTRQLCALSPRITAAAAIEWVLNNCRARQFYLSEDYAEHQMRQARHERLLRLAARLRRSYR